jgi:hypothetical protein
MFSQVPHPSPPIFSFLECNTKQGGVVAEYTSDQRTIERTTHGAATQHNNDIVGAFSYNIFVGVFVATVFGSAFFFDLFWPERKESRAVAIAWKACGVLSCAFALASALLLTVLVSTHEAALSGPADGVEVLLKAPLGYRRNAEAIASVCLIWPGGWRRFGGGFFA